jgi:hypothetical protein
VLSSVMKKKKENMKKQMPQHTVDGGGGASSLLGRRVERWEETALGTSCAAQVGTLGSWAAGGACGSVGQRRLAARSLLVAKDVERTAYSKREKKEKERTTKYQAVQLGIWLKRQGATRK